eukprot:gene10207-30071_t
MRSTLLATLVVAAQLAIHAAMSQPHPPAHYLTPTATATATANPHNDGCFNVRDYGAVGDGVTDDTAAFQQAVTAAAPHAGCVRVPPVGLGRGYVITGTVTLGIGIKLVGEPAGLPTAPWCFSAAGGDITTTGGSRIFARPAAASYSNATQTGQPLFHIRNGCTVRDEEFNAPSSEYYLPAAALQRQVWQLTKVPPVGPTIYVVEGTRVVIEDVVASRFRDFLYFETGGGQSHVRRVHGWGYGRFITVEIAEDVMSFDTLRYIINAGPECLGQKPSEAVCKANPTIERCRGSFTVMADGYVASDLFFFGINTAVRLGVAAAPGFNLTNPLTGVALTEAGAASAGTLLPGHGPWGNIRGLMVDQAVIGIHMVWPNPLSNRFSDCQLHPSFWTGRVFHPPGGSSNGGGGMGFGTGNLTRVGYEAAVLVEPTHTVLNNAKLQSTTMFSNMVVASFTDAANFGNVSSTLTTSNGRAFAIGGDGLIEVSQFAMNNERNAGTHLWAASASSKLSLRIRGGIYNYTPDEDVVVAQNLDFGADGSRQEL